MKIWMISYRYWLSGIKKIVQIRHHRFICKKYYFLKSQIHDPDTPNYMEALSGENMDIYFKEMDDEIQSLMRRDTWYILQGSQLLIKMCFQKHGLSSSRGNLIGQ